jgi:restriction system protein
LATQRWHHDLAQAQARESERLARLAAYRRDWEKWYALRCMELRAQHASINLMKHRLTEGDPQTVADYIVAVLDRSAWPDGFPRTFDVAFDPSERHLVVDYAGPAFDVVPTEKAFRYVKASDEIRPVALAASDRKTIYRDVIAQLVLRVAHEVFEADRLGHIDRATVNCFVTAVDPATGRDAERCVATLSISRPSLLGVDLAAVEPIACLRGFKGQLIERPETGSVVAAVRVAQFSGTAGSSDLAFDDDPNLLDMDPIEFELLVGQLFSAMGLDVSTTKRSGDGGVDLVATNPDPFLGGTVLVQVKRYRQTVSPDVVRDMYGTLHHNGANKGIVVTTSSFGPSAHEFAQQKPLELIEGDRLVHLLHTHGLPGRIVWR